MTPPPLPSLALLHLLLLALLFPGTPSVVFHATYKRGPKSAASPIACAGQCASVSGCVGYEMAAVAGAAERVNASTCKLLNSPPTKAKNDTWIYASSDRVAGYEPCLPIAARSSSLNFYLYFSDHTGVYKFSMSNATAILHHDWKSVKDLREDYDQLYGKSYSAIFTTETTHSGKKHLYIAVGADMELYEYSHSVTGYLLQPGYPRPIAEEVGVSPAPALVSAMMKTTPDYTVYMLQGDTMFVYNVTGKSPGFVYEFITTFEMSRNGPSNPFSAGPGSPLPHPPRDVTAMVHPEAGGSKLLAFAGKSLYVFTTATREWEYKGEVKTPCS